MATPSEQHAFLNRGFTAARGCATLQPLTEFAQASNLEGGRAAVPRSSPRSQIRQPVVAQAQHARDVKWRSASTLKRKTCSLPRGRKYLAATLPIARLATRRRELLLEYEPKDDVEQIQAFEHVRRTARHGARDQRAHQLCARRERACLRVVRVLERERG